MPPALQEPLAAPSRVPRWRALANLIRLGNQTGTWLLLLPVLWALVIASHGRPSLRLLAIFTAGAFVMRSAGVVLNDLADRSIDRQVPRTRLRPLAAGSLQPRDALLACGLLLAAAAALLAALPLLPMLLSPVALLLAALYPYAKRAIPVPQIILGLAFGWGVMMAWAAVQETLPASAWLLYAATVCWAVGYDTVYALQDREADARLGVRSAAVYFGDRSWLAVAGAIGLMLTLLAAVGLQAHAGRALYAALALIGIIQGREIALVRRGLSGGQALGWFKRQVWIGAAVLAAFWIALLDGS
jgi:4-hydroxybenzoate polyprenyltransferase